MSAGDSRLIPLPNFLILLQFLMQWQQRVHLNSAASAFILFAVSKPRKSQWPCGLRCVPAATRLMGLPVRIPRGEWMPVSCMFCLAHVSASGLSLVQRSPTEWGVCVCGREASIMRRPWPTRAVES